MDDVEKEPIFALYGNVCIWCLRPASVLHHLIPTGAGGDDAEDNRIPLCAACHRRVHDVGPLLMKGKLRGRADVVRQTFTP